MSLPYGTLSDDEIRSLPLHHLQGDEGLLFLWVTGRCVELGKELLATWGYKQVRSHSHKPKLSLIVQVPRWLSHV